MRIKENVPGLTKPEYQCSESLCRLKHLGAYYLFIAHYLGSKRKEEALPEGGLYEGPPR